MAVRAHVVGWPRAGTTTQGVQGRIAHVPQVRLQPLGRSPSNAARKDVVTMMADVHVIDRSQLYTVIGSALADLAEVGVIVGDIDVADEQIVSAIHTRWTAVFTATEEVSA
ncbi:hypothetical protein [Nocardia sp. NPDC050406]|uniref:hypothetical protein n=1 Tax=Nocardia sp. NPDC050406 TaxID=3364318 RepID=UPI0037BB839D